MLLGVCPHGRHTCPPGASSQADHRRPGVFLHAARQKARRVPQIEWGGTEDRGHPQSRKLQENSHALMVGDLVREPQSRFKLG